MLENRERAQIDTGHVQRPLLIAVEALRITTTLCVPFVDASDAIALGSPAPCQHTSGPLENAWRVKLPPDSQVSRTRQRRRVGALCGQSGGSLKLEHCCCALAVFWARRPRYSCSPWCSR
ncbi:hypothetical protein [Paraburkholderia sp. RAU2J]|uniref:hypothetical protein n=1 Tax=Paraburkholderia sp. RAU2J TaxID=1938810 RepID=UPI000EADE82D|nr:hypothetical protein [Paraburkholderia sp. RAU2J]